MSKKSETEGGLKTSVKVALMLVLLVGLGLTAWAVTKPYRQGLPEERVERPENRGPAMGRPGTPPSPDERRQRMGEMADRMGLTDAQRAQMKEVMEQGRPTSQEDMEQRRAAMAKILTPAQQQQMRQAMAGRMAQRLEESRDSLSAEDFAALQKRMEDRMTRGGGFGGGRGGPGGR